MVHVAKHILTLKIHLVFLGYSMKSNCNNIKCILASVLIPGVLLSVPASATVLTSNISMDNGYQIYISTSDTVAGTLFGANNDWNTTFSDTTTLTPGVNYFLHVYGYDQGWIAGFLGQFTLSGSDHVFSNGTSSLLTNATDWSGNSSGFASPYSTLTDIGADGMGPWFDRPNIANSAHWIWVGDPYDNDFSYFTTSIRAVSQGVPEPSALALVGLGIFGLGFGKTRRTR